MFCFNVTGESKKVFGDERFVRGLRFMGEPTEKEIEEAKKKLKHRYRVCDDDGQVYFWGFATSSDDEDAFFPLDSLGVNYGCTYIEYKENKKWKIL